MYNFVRLRRIKTITKDKAVQSEQNFGLTGNLKNNEFLVSVNRNV